MDTILTMDTCQSTKWIPHYPHYGPFPLYGYPYCGQYPLMAMEPKPPETGSPSTVRIRRKALDGTVRQIRGMGCPTCVWCALNRATSELRYVHFA